MVSLLQDQSNIKFSSSDTLERDQQDLMKTQGDSISPVQQSDNPSYSCQPYESGVRTERKSSESSHSPSPASPAQSQIQGRFPTSQGIPCGKNKFKASFSTEKLRRFSYEDRTGGNYEQFLQSSRTPFHPYKRQVSEEVFQETPQALPPEASPFKPPRSIDGFEGLPGSAEPESFPTHLPTIPGDQPWCNSLQYSPPGQEHSPQLMQDSDLKLRTSPLEGQPGLYCYQPQVQEMYCPSHPFHQYPSGGSYPVTYITSSHYPYPRIAPQSSQDSQQPLFPKPIYSYSILIFMALKNSKTGSLPVSEIYNFMTEHFPYFKTAPDGWKNSVRHNLSLNKCFEKVENKSGNSSRKGCLWALNPAKIDKMQEELQKWKRKDPVAVRKSMAKPEELDTLIGERSEKLRCPGQPCGSLCGPGVPQPGVPQPVRGIPAHAVPAGLAGQQPQCFPSPHGFPHGPGSLLLPPGEPQTLLVPGGAQGGLRSQPGSAQESPLPAQTPPRCALRALPEPPDGQGELLPDGDLSSDIDALNPSLTDFELQGNLWEELKDDSLAVDPLVLISSSPLSPPCFPSPCHLQGGGSGSSSSSISIPSAAPAGAGAGPGPDLQLTTLYSAFMELDTVAPAYLSPAGSTPIALM